MEFPFEYRTLGKFTYNVLTDRLTIKAYLTKWIMKEWESDHNQAPDEHWTVQWMNVFPRMEFELKILPLEDIRPNADLFNVEDFQRGLKELADDREESMLCGVSIEALLVNRHGFELMDGYTRYTVLIRHGQKEVYAYVGTVGRACEVPVGGNLT